MMWTISLCHLRCHDYGLCLERGSMFLHCVRCGHRSPGWALDGRLDTTGTQVSHAAAPAPVVPPLLPQPVPRQATYQQRARVLPFTRSFAG
jgi:hypothetical protein